MYMYVSIGVSKLRTPKPIFGSCINISLVCNCKLVCVRTSVLSYKCSYFMNFVNTIFFAPISSLHLHFTCRQYRIYQIWLRQSFFQSLSCEKIINSVWERIEKSVYNFVTLVNLARANRTHFFSVHGTVQHKVHIYIFADFDKLFLFIVTVVGACMFPSFSCLTEFSFQQCEFWTAWNEAMKKKIRTYSRFLPQTHKYTR